MYIPQTLYTYAEKIWDPETADYLQLMPVKERRKKDQQEQTALDGEDDSDDGASPTGDLTHTQNCRGSIEGRQKIQA
jgi:hypothetical protein